MVYIIHFLDSQIQQVMYNILINHFNLLIQINVNNFCY